MFEAFGSHAFPSFSLVQVRLALVKVSVRTLEKPVSWVLPIKNAGAVQTRNTFIQCYRDLHSSTKLTNRRFKVLGCFVKFAIGRNKGQRHYKGLL